jgi:threonine/homoserine/homoserine lactone efflux protein
LKSFRIQKQTEQEPAVYGMALVPLVITASSGLTCLLLAVVAGTTWATIFFIVLFLTILVLSNYLYRINVLDQISDQRHPKKVKNDIL